MKIKTREFDCQKYIILKENESIVILANKEIKSSVHILCKNKKLILTTSENRKKVTKS